MEQITSKSKGKKYLIKVFVIFLSLINFSSFAQQAKTEIEVVSGVYYTVVVKFETELYTMSIEVNGSEIVQPISISTFSSDKLFNYIKDSYVETTSTIHPDPSGLQQRSALKFMELVAALYNKSEVGQKIATIKLEDKLNVYDKNLAVIGQFDVSKCQIVFEDGFIKTIVTSGKIGNELITFSNGYAIGISTRSNIQWLNKNRLYNENDRDDERNIIVAELIKYSRILAVRTNDYSPQDQTITLFSGKNQTLSKSPSTKLFQLKIFSDFAGINQNNPNGLVQTEFSKRINIWTKRWKMLWTRSLGFGLFTHLNPILEISKIEENNRFLPLQQGTLVEDSSLNKLYFISPIEAYRYSTLRVATELNILDIQGSSASLHFNGIFGLNLTHVKDSIYSNEEIRQIDETLNSIQLGMIGKLILEPESKWGYQISDKVVYTNNLNNNFEYHSLSKDGLVPPKQLINTLEFLITWKTGSDNKVFGRFRFNHELDNWKNNFSQFQLGYSIFLKSGKS